MDESNGERLDSHTESTEEGSKKNKRKTSKVHNYFEDESEKEFKCKCCGMKLTKQTSGSTSHLIKHLSTNHKAEFEAFRTETPARKRQKPGSSVPEPLNRSIFLQKLQKFIVACDQPYSVVERTEFQDLIDYISKDTTVTAIPGRFAITAGITEDYNDKKTKVMKKLAEGSKVNLVVDAWTSSNKIAFLGVMCRFVDKDFKLVTLPLDLIQLSGSHSGENLAHAFLPVLDEFGLWDKIISITTDNASNNDTFLKFVAEALINKGILFDVKEQRIRCFAHVLNLCAQVLLREARKSVPLDKLHKAISEIGRTPQRKEIYYLQCGERKLLPGLDCEIRWNSTFDMLSSALEMRSAIHSTCQEGFDGSLQCYVLSDHVWDQLQRLKEILAPIHKATLRISEQKNPCIAEATKNYQDLFEHFDRCLMGVDRTSWEYISTKEAKNKLLEYYTDTGGRAYCIGVMLHPSYKTKWFKKKNWPNAWINQYKRSISLEWIKNYKTMHQPSMENTESLNSEEREYREVMGTSSAADELEKYLKEPTVELHHLNKVGVLEWWKARVDEYPRLSSMAKDYLSVAGSSVPVESFFSSGTDILTDNRQRLTGQHIKELMCLKKWHKLNF